MPQVIVTQLLAALAVCAVQVFTGTVTLLEPQVIVVQLLPADGACGVQV